MIIKIDHINLTVSNLDESVAWYRKIFGLELVESGTTYQGRKWGIVAYNDFMICMSEYPERETADKFDEEVFHQINHFGIRISDAKKWQQVVEEQKIKLHYGGAIKYRHSTSWYVHDPSGHEIEVSFAENGRAA